MNNMILDTTSKNFTAAAEMTKQAAALNVASLDKLVNFQFSTATNLIDNGFKQLAAFAKVNSVDDLTAVSTTVFQAYLKQDQNQTHELTNLLTESRDAYQALIETAKAPAAVKPVPKRPAPVKTQTKPESKTSA